MANSSKQTPQAAAETKIETAVAMGAWEIFAEEERQDRLLRMWAIAGAILLHIAIGLVYVFAPPMPSFARAMEDADVFVVQQVRFRPPPPPQQEIPEPQARRVPIPDPTPDEPVPIVTQRDIQPDIDLPDTDLIFGDIEAPPAQPTGPIQVGGDVLPPRKISGADPAYTEIARRARVEGVVIVQAIVDKEGLVQNVKVLKGLPMGLDQAAADAVKRWRFEPATLHGQPVDVYYTLTVNFQLN